MTQDTKTPFEKRCEIVADLWIKYGEEPELSDFMSYNDLGLIYLETDPDKSLEEFNVVYNRLRFEEYYFKDVRTTFSENIVLLDCTQFKTCLTFESGLEQCFGNVDDVPIIFPFLSFVIGVVVLLLSMTIFGFWFSRRYITENKIVTVVVGLIPASIIFISLHYTVEYSLIAEILGMVLVSLILLATYIGTIQKKLFVIDTIDTRAQMAKVYEF